MYRLACRDHRASASGGGSVPVQRRFLRPHSFTWRLHGRLIYRIQGAAYANQLRQLIFRICFVHFSLSLWPPPPPCSRPEKQSITRRSLAWSFHQQKSQATKKSPERKSDLNCCFTNGIADRKSALEVVLSNFILSNFGFYCSQCRLFTEASLAGTFFFRF